MAIKNKTKSNRGGSRTGAGRPKKHEGEMDTVSFYLPKSIITDVKKYVEKKKKNAQITVESVGDEIAAAAD